jgi:predicted Zn finger-like uncharacterized protein
MTLTIGCPSCRRQLRVPEDLLGQPVKCPSCEATFTASEDGAARPPPAEEKVAPPPAGDDHVAEQPGTTRPPRPGRARADEGDRGWDEDEDDYDSRPRRPLRRCRSRVYAESRVSGPASALSVTGGIALGLSTLALVLHLCLGAAGGPGRRADGFGGPGGDVGVNVLSSLNRHSLGGASSSPPPRG